MRTKTQTETTKAASLKANEQHAADEAEVIRQLRAIRKDGGGSGFGELRIPIADDRVQIVEVTRKVKPEGVDRQGPSV